MLQRPEAEGRIIIVGGGIGGLALAIALGQQERPVTLLERSAFADESGAGIQLGPNATRVLTGLGVLDAVAGVASRPDALCIFDALSGRRLAAVPLGDKIEQRYDAPYLTLKRADLHARLLEAARDLSSVTLKTCFEIVGAEQRTEQVVARGADGELVEGTALIGADGLWSTIRAFASPAADLRFAHKTAWRVLLPRDKIPTRFDPGIVGLWLAPHAHLVHYPAGASGDLNLVLVMDGGAPIRGWSEPADRKQLLARFTRWADEPNSLLAAAEDWRGWSLYAMPPLHRWSNGNLVLIGDAAHPVLPHLAQGAALAIEDAVTLAKCLESSAGSPAIAFRRYERLRRQRVRRVQRQSARLGSLYHLHGLPRLIRNALLRRRDPERFLKSLDWLYRSSR